MHMYTRKSVIYVFCMSAHTHVCIYKYTHLLYTYIFRYYMIHIYCICFFWTSPATLDIGIHALHIFIRRNPPEHLLSIQLQRCCRWLQDELPDRQIQIWNEVPNSANPVSSCVIWRRFSAPQLWNISRYSVFIVFVKTWFSCALYFYCAVSQQPRWRHGVSVVQTRFSDPGEAPQQCPEQCFLSDKSTDATPCCPASWQKGRSHQRYQSHPAHH